MISKSRILPLACAATLFGPVAQGRSPGGYDLTAAPQPAPGEVFQRTASQTFRTSVIDSDGETLQESLTVIDSTETQEVVAVDEAGGVTAFRHRLVAATMQTTFKGPGGSSQQATVELSDVFCLARRCGETFKVDTTTIASETLKSLTASRLALLKKFFNSRMDFYAHRQRDALLMPDEPVRPGSKWSPEPARMLQWLLDNPATRGAGIEQPTGSFSLEAVADGLAVLRGSITFTCRLGPRPAKARIDVSFRIDPASGLWISISTSSRLTAEADDAVLLVEAITSATTVRQGSAASGPASRPGGPYRLGWPEPPPDTNSYRSAAGGLSLDVPEEYRPVEVDDNGAIVAAFAAGNDRSITITLKDSQLPMDMDTLAPRVLGNLKKFTAGYVTLEERSLTLPDNIPAMMTMGQAHDGAMVIVAVFAIDGTRLVSVMASAPAGQDAYIAEMKRILQSLRLFEPELSPAR